VGAGNGKKRLFLKKRVKSLLVLGILEVIFGGKIEKIIGMKAQFRGLNPLPDGVKMGVVLAEKFEKAGLDF